MVEDPKLAASLMRRLLNASRAIGIPHELAMRRYAFERLMARLAASPGRERLVLKGAMAFLAVTGDVRRPTRDIDFTGTEPVPEKDALDLLREVASILPEEPDGVLFHGGGFTSEPIRAGGTEEEPGVRIQGNATIGTARIPLRIEISYGHAITPGPVLAEYPSILDDVAPPKVLIYPRETMLAEKFQTVCSLGTRTSRLRDFYDLRGMARLLSFDGETAAEAFRRTFSRRGTPIPTDDPTAFGSGFAEEGRKGWDAWLRKQGMRGEQTFSDVVDEIRPLVMGVSAMALGERPTADWEAGTGWTETPRPSP